MLKNISSLGTVLNKTEQQSINGGHNPYDPNCLANCSAIFQACQDSPNTYQQCLDQLSCCQSECAPPGGHVR